SWQGLSANSQLSFTLPYYIVIAIVAAIIHTYGYSLIFRAQATPGGLEIFTSHFSSQKGKKKVSISTLMKIFGLGIIFLVTLVNFAVIEDDSKMRKSLLQKEIEEQKEKFEENGLKITEKDIKEAKQLEKNENPDLKKIFALREKNRPLTSLLKNKTGFQKLENYPQEIRYYLACPDEKKEKLQAERDKIERKINSVSGEKLVRKLRRKNDLENRIKELDKEKERSAPNLPPRPNYPLTSPFPNRRKSQQRFEIVEKIFSGLLHRLSSKRPPRGSYSFKINNNQKSFIELSVQKFNFPTEKGDKEIEKISFEDSLGSGSAGLKDKDQLEAILKTGEAQNLELSFDEEKVKIIVIKPQPANTMFAMGSGSEDENQPPKIRTEQSTSDDSQNQKQQDQNQSDDQNKKKSGDTDKQALIDKY
ncbi:7956_t:CDS:2, partial [Racocetra persica]